MLEDHAHLPPDGIDVGLFVVDDGAFKNDFALGWVLQQVEAAQKGGLAGPGRADNNHFFPLVNMLGDIVQD